MPLATSPVLHLRCDTYRALQTAEVLGEIGIEEGTGRHHGKGEVLQEVVIVEDVLNGGGGFGRVLAHRLRPEIGGEMFRLLLFFSFSEV